jgi:hypothetical protein
MRLVDVKRRKMGTVVQGPWKGRSELRAQEEKGFAPTFDHWRTVFVDQCNAEVEKKKSFIGSSLIDCLFAAANKKPP